MAAKTIGGRIREERWTYSGFPMPTGTSCFRNGLAALNSAGKVVPFTAAAGLTCIGVFTTDVANTSGADVTVTVQLKREVVLLYFVNDTTNPVTTIGTPAYGIDDQTVSSLSTGRSAVGTVWDIDVNKGVGVELT